ncbi:gamma-glutamylcyclotransferase family protein [Rhodomicrobium lacus]|uniref:gamma-glutamylcyclotransferase family protein n=1 Tax=Rhodomicrobium lacus TaxID=2498452 RepID=UPI0026E27E30|nr:gamma-glutamylcyclotransferase family protein [Rhodomicrobium lacus]WKW52128.1 gamma-glutamylcyclotransferase family protein [Rhodomicrobium lacus]
MKSITLLSARPSSSKPAKPSARSAPVLAFIYGAAMNPAWLAERGIRAEPLAIARLPDQRLSFHGYNQVWDGAEEATLPAQGKDVWGVVYKVAGLDVDRLDAAQGVRLNGTGTYFHFPVEVVGAEGTVYTAVMYRKAALRDERPPSAEYLAYIVQGAKARELPADYIDAISAIASVPAAYPVPLKANSTPQAAESECC